MELSQTIDIIYQYISKDSSTSKSPKFIIPDIPTKSLTFESLNHLLSQDNVDVSKITMIEYYNERKSDYCSLSSSDLPILNQTNLVLLLYTSVKSSQDKLIEIQKRLDNLEKQIKKQQMSSNSTLSDLNPAKKQTTFIYEKEFTEPSTIDYIYLYASPLYIKNNNLCNFENDTNDYEEEIDSLVNIMNQTNCQFAAEFTRANDEDFIMAFRKAPAILHVSGSVLIEKVNDEPKCFLCLEKDGEMIKINEDEIQITIRQEINSSKIKLVVLSTPNSKALGKCFHETGISSVICIENKSLSMSIAKQSNSFTKLFYSMIFKGATIATAFARAKSALNHENFALFGRGDYALFNKPKGKVQVNNNCIVNCKFNKENAMKLYGRNQDMHYAFRLFTINDNRVVITYGVEGVGKKFFSKKVGKYLFELKFFSGIHFIESTLISGEDIKAQIINIELKSSNANSDNNTNSNTTPSNGNIYHNNNLYSPNKEFEYFFSNSNIPPISNNTLPQNNKILVIVSFENFQDDNSLKTIEDLFEGLKNRHRNMSFLISLTVPFADTPVNFRKFPKIHLKKISSLSSTNLFTRLSHIYPYTINLSKAKIEEITRSANGLPSEIYLRVGYICQFQSKIFNCSLKTSDIIQDILQSEFHQKVFFTFCALFKGISKLELYHLVSKDKLEKIKGLIVTKYYSKIIDDSIFELDRSFIKYIIPNIKENVIKESIRDIFKIYSIILRNVIIKEIKDLDITQEYSASLNHGIWQSLNSGVFNEYYKLHIDNIYPSMQYHEENIRNILFKFKDTITNIINENDPEFIEYFEQISICLPTILQHKGKQQAAIDLVSIFIALSQEYSLNVNEIRLLMFKYFISNNLNIIKHIEPLIENKEAQKEFCLLKLYQLSKDNLYFNNSDVYYEKAFIIISESNDQFDLARLNYLSGLCNKNTSKSIEYFDKAIDYAKKSNCVFIIIKSYIAKALYELKNHFYSKAKILSFKGRKLHSTLMQNSSKILQIELDNLITSINSDYKQHSKNIFTFIESNQLLNSYNVPICSLANDAYSFKAELQCKLSNKIKVNYQMLTLKNFKQLFTYPGTFLFISSDDYDSEGNLYCEDQNGQSQKITNDDIKSIIQNGECVYDLVILSFINSEYIAKEFVKKGFPNVIAYKSIYPLLKSLGLDSIFLINFKKYMKKFVIDLLVNILEKKSILDAFTFAKNIFTNHLQNIFPSLIDTSSINSPFSLVNYNEDYDDLLMLLPSSTSHEEELFNLDNSSSSSLQACSSSCDGNSEMKSSISIINSNLGNISNTISFLSKTNDTTIDRMIGRKQQLFDLAQLVKQKQFINIYGEEKCGKSLLGIELCKMFYMKNTFRQGVFYVNAAKDRSVKDIDIIKKIKKHEDNNMLIILDNAEKSLSKVNAVNDLPKMKFHYIFILKEKMNDQFVFNYHLRNTLNEFYAKELFNYLLSVQSLEYTNSEYKHFLIKTNYMVNNIKKLASHICNKKGRNVDLKGLKMKENEDAEYEEELLSSIQTKGPVDSSFSLMSIFDTGDKSYCYSLTNEYEDVIFPYIERVTLLQNSICP